MYEIEGNTLIGALLGVATLILLLSIAASPRMRAAFARREGDA